MRCVVWDCDGTVVDSEPIGIGVWTEVLVGLGCEPTEADWEALVGRPFPAFYEHFSARCVLPPPAELMDTYTERLYPALRSGLQAFGDAIAVIDKLAEDRVPMAIASSSHRGRLDLMLEVVGLVDRFDSTVAGDEVTTGKPDPAIYLAAAARLGYDPGDCMAVEDTVHGVRAAAAAGMRVVGVARGARVPADLSDADIVVTKLDVDQFADLLQNIERRG